MIEVSQPVSLVSAVLLIMFTLSQMMFEEYNFAGVYIAIQAVLTLYAQGKHSPLPQLSALLHTAPLALRVVRGATKGRERRRLGGRC